MKQILVKCLIIMALVLVGTTACKKDDGTSKYKDLIVGEWEAFDDECVYDVEFKSNGKYTWYTCDLEGYAHYFEGKYSISGKTLTFTNWLDEGRSGNMTIEKLTSALLTLSYKGMPMAFERY